MIKLFALQELDGNIQAVSTSRETLEHSELEIIEINHDDAPLTEVGELLSEKVTELLKGAYETKLFRSANFYEISADARVQYIYDLLQDYDNQDKLIVSRYQPTIFDEYKSMGLVLYSPEEGDDGLSD